MTGHYPGALRYHLDGDRTVSRAFSPRPPEAGEVLVEAAGSAIGAAPGSEVAGRVIAAGETASEWLGRRVVIPRVLPCGECGRCRRGRTAACESAFVREGAVATHETVPARFLLSVEPPLWPGDERLPSGPAGLACLAALADAAAAPYGALVRAQVAPGELCVIVGAGVRGRFAAGLARALGAHPIVLDGDPHLRELALAAGARSALDSASLDTPALAERLASEATSLGAAPGGPKLIETTGSAAGRRRALELATPGGVAALLSDGDGYDLRIPIEALCDGEAVVLGAAACHPDLLPELCALVVRGELDLASQVQLLPFDDYAAAVAERRAGHLELLPVLMPSTTHSAVSTAS